MAVDCATTQFLLGPHARTVIALQLISKPPIESGAPGDVAAVMDRYLAAQLLVVTAT